MRRTLISLIAINCLVALPASAWKGASAGFVHSIAEIQERAESGDRVWVEGRIVDVTTGSGSRRIITLEDDTGRLPIRVPEHLIRHFQDEGARPRMGSRVRVGGKWTHAYLDRDVWGIHAQEAELLDR